MYRCVSACSGVYFKSERKKKKKERKRKKRQKERKKKERKKERKKKELKMALTESYARLSF